MGRINKRKLLVVALITATIGTAQAELSSLQQQVVADNEAMKTMNAEDRRAFRQEIWNNSDKVAQRQYNQAYKGLVEAGVITSKSEKKSGIANTQTQARRLPGSNVTYHSGALAAATTSSFMIGNQFDSALNPAGTALFPVQASGSITMVTFDMAAVGGTVAFLSVYDQLAGTTANQVTSMGIAAATGLNTVTLATALNYTGPSVLAGIWNFSGATDTVNLATGTVGGQGFHAVQINDGSPGNSFATIANMNAAFAIGGNIATPVELLNFSID